jgi:hypothetical protein
MTTSDLVCSEPKKALKPFSNCSWLSNATATARGFGAQPVLTLVSHRYWSSVGRFCPSCRLFGPTFVLIDLCIDRKLAWRWSACCWLCFWSNL